MLKLSLICSQYARDMLAIFWRKAKFHDLVVFEKIARGCSQPLRGTRGVWCNRSMGCARR